MLILLASLSSRLYAQNNIALYPFNELYNAYQYNPAFLSSPEKFTLSIFPISGFGFSMNNQAIIQEAIRKSSSMVFSDAYYKDLFNRLIARPTFHEQAEVPFLSFSYGSKKGFFNFSIRDRQFLDANVKGEVTDFIFRSGIFSTTIGALQHFPVQSAHYREYSLGYSYTSRDKRFTAGMRGKLYLGKYAFYSDIDATIGQKESAYGMITKGMFNISFPGQTITNEGSDTYQLDLSKTSITHYLFNRGNRGLGLDLGLMYRLNKQLSLSMSLIDLGSIHWRNNLKSRDFDKLFTLYDTSYTIGNQAGVPVITKRETDSYSQSFRFFDLKTDSVTSFTRWLPVNLFAGIKYQLNPGLSLSVTDRATSVKNLFYNTVSVAANMAINKKLSYSAGYSIIGKSYLNIPMVLLLKQRYGQVYVATDNFAYFLFSSKADYASFSIGACVYPFSHRKILLPRSEDLPFYQPRRTIHNRGTGLLIGRE